MHYRTSVIFSTQVINLVEVILEEVELHTTLDVAPVDGDVVVSVRPGVLMEESQGVHDLVSQTAPAAGVAHVDVVSA